MRVDRKLTGLLAWLVLSVPAPAIFASTALPNRVALIVGANRPGPGRLPLQHAYRDADRMLEVLTTVGRFSRQNVSLLHDPSASEVLAVIDRHAAAPRVPGESLFFFYYSGHADERSLNPAGEALSFESLRAALDRTGAAVRVGVVDACRGGAWTRAKGMTPDTSFEVDAPINLGSEGSVLIASSSGSESAHESDQLQGSFFTHHFVAGLLGAADKSENGEVTVSEAFEYAKMRTVRDTARVTREAQHPSYAMNLRGRQDLVLAQIATSPSSLLLAQSEGPLEIIQLDSGLSVLELAPGKRRVRVALRPGRYLVRRTVAQGTLAEEVSVVPGVEKRIEEAHLTMMGVPPMLAKGGADEPPALTNSTLRHRDVALGLAFGIYAGTRNFNFWPDPPARAGDNQIHPAIAATALWGLTDRLTWGIGLPTFAYRFGQRGGWEVIPAGGAYGVGYSSLSGLILELGAQVAIRRWWSTRTALTASVRGVSQMQSSDDFRLTSVYGYGANLGISSTFRDVITFNLAAGVHRDQKFVAEGPQWSLQFGSVQQIGLRQRPLIQLHLTNHLDVDVHAWVAQMVARPPTLLGTSPSTSFTAMFGLTYVF